MSKKMSFFDFKSLIEQGNLISVEQSIDNSDLDPADINILVRELIKNKSKNIAIVLDKLLKKGADVNFADVKNKKSILMVACQQGTIEAVDLLIANPKIDFDFQDSMKKTAPYYVIENKNKNDAEVFLDKILNKAPHLTNRAANNQTLLILAIKKQKPQLVRILLNHNATPNYVIADSGNTPLHQALKMCKNKQTKANKDIVKMLIEYGADPMIKNKKDKNVFEFAQKFPLDQLIAQVQVKPRFIQEKAQITSSVNQNREKITKENEQTPRGNKNNKNDDSNRNKSSERTKKKIQITPPHQKWQQSPVRQEKSRKEFKNKDLKEQQRQNKEHRDNRQNRQNRDYRQTRQNRDNKNHAQKVFAANTQQQINDLIRKADQIYDRQMGKKQHNRPMYQKRNDQPPEMLSQDERESYCSQASDSDSEIEESQDSALAPSFRKKEEFTQSLSQEIIRLEKRCDEVYHTVQREFEKIYTKIRQIAFTQGLDIQLYGSFKTGLWYKNCDIDILLIPLDQMIADKNPNYIENILDRFQLMLKKDESLKINTVIKNKKIRVPTLRLDIETSPYNRSRNRKVDITVFDRNHNGLNIAHYINQNSKLFPQLKPLFFVIKSLTYHFKLNDPKTGGIRTYGIVIMILSFLQNERMKGTKVEQAQLGELLLRFLYFFGYEYQYGYEMSQQHPGATVEPKMKLMIYDPLNHSNNLGNNAKAYELQSMFKAAFISLHANIKEEKLEFMFGLKKICIF